MELIDAVKELQMQEAETANEWLCPEYQHILTHADALRAEVKRRYGRRVSRIDRVRGRRTSIARDRCEGRGSECTAQPGPSFCALVNFDTGARGHLRASQHAHSNLL